MSNRKRKHVFMPSQDEINEQVLDCMDDIIDVTKHYHIAIRYTALNRIILDEQHILKSGYTFRDEIIPRKRDTKTPDTTSVI